MEIHFEILERCMLKCRHCSSLASEYGEMMKYSEQDMIRFLTQIEEKKDIYLTGGEPLLYPNLRNLLMELKNNVSDLDIGLFTTGIMKDEEGIKSISIEYAKELANVGLKVCYVSVYSNNGEEHDWMTKLQGSFKLLNHSIKNLQEEGVEIRFNSVVTAKNMKCFESIIEYAEELNVTEVRMLKLIKHGRACNEWNDLGISEKGYREVVYNALKRKNRLQITASGLTDVLPCRHEYRIKECPASQYLLYITNEGNVFPCASVKRRENYLIGNIKDADIFEKYNLFKGNLKGSMLCV